MVTMSHATGHCDHNFTTALHSCQLNNINKAKKFVSNGSIVIKMLIEKPTA